jgi:glutamate racemase
MIGIFDSGIGGLTVASAIRKQAPNAELMYFADFAHMPFGKKTEQELLEITKNAIQFLSDHGATEIVAACNSVSLLVSGLRSEIPIPLIEMSESTVNALSDQQSGSVMIVATEATVRSKMYETAFLKKGIETTSLSIPELASAIEREAPLNELRALIQPSIDQAILLNCKTLVLGCTQFPFARHVFEQLFQERSYVMHVFDPADAVAKEVVSRFQIRGAGTQQFYLSKASLLFDQQVKRMFGGETETQII